MKLRHYVPRTQRSYCSRAGCFPAYVDGQGARLPHAEDRSAFLSPLATARRGAASTQNQALSPRIRGPENRPRGEAEPKGALSHRSESASSSVGRLSPRRFVAAATMNLPAGMLIVAGPKEWMACERDRVMTTAHRCHLEKCRLAYPEPAIHLVRSTVQTALSHPSHARSSSIQG